jgi:glycosyltransferase involved in cell wall biosynthesis
MPDNQTKRPRLAPLTTNRQPYTAAMNEPQPPLFIFRHAVDFPSQQAYALQVALNVYALADAGAEVWLSFSHWTVRTIEEALAAFGLKPHPRIKMLRWPRFTRGLRAWTGPLFRWVIRRKLRKVAARRPVFYILDKGANFETILDLAKIRDALNARIVLESHVQQADYLTNKLEADGPKDEAEIAKWARVAELERRAVKAVDLLIGVSEALREKLCTSAGRTASSVVLRNGSIPSPVPDTPLSARRGVVYLGHPYRSKGVDDLIAAMARIPGVPLKVVGCRNQEDTDKVMGWATGQGVRDRVTVTGFMPNAQVFGELATARVGVVPLQHGDGSPMKAFEYLAAGLPVVATDVPANQEIIRESGGGTLVPPHNPEALATAIREVLENDAVAETYRASGMAWIRENTWQRRAERLIAELERVPAPGDKA